MKKFMILTALLVSTLLFTSCDVNIGGTGNVSLGTVAGSGEMVLRDFAPGDFNAIEISGSFSVSFTEDSAAALTVNMQENLFEHLEVDVRSNTLHVRSTRTFNTTPSNRPHISIYAPALSAISFAGAVDTVDWDHITGQSFTIDAAGAANVELSLNVENLEISIAGASDVKLTGTADTADISIAGASSVSALELFTRDAAVSIAGAGNVDIAVSEHLDASIAGAGRIRYLGDPAVSRSIAGVGTIRPY
ncbi:MAG: DUF2807 domain-containing protein [Defluviitaleaceae bacterium]|nr:DUF2807 domain-containing protein [Defluviitaleaceae bacterium]